MSAIDPALQPFSVPVRTWFQETFHEPSPPQRLGWPAITEGKHTLITAPTGSGKTLAAFLWCLDRLFAELQQGAVPVGVHTLYVSPLKALNYDVERNLKEPLRGIRQAARTKGQDPPRVRVAVRTGDTTQSQRAAMLRTPPHVLITTPESLFILLTSPRARHILTTVRYVITDEVHALCGSKRGLSLSLSLERLERLCAQPPVRIGLSATINPLEQAAAFIGGQQRSWGGYEPRPVTVVDAGRRKEMDLQVMAPVPDFTNLADDSVWPEVYRMLLDHIRKHHSTLVFVRMRAQAERTARALNDLAAAELARPHHSSLSTSLRREIEDQLKEGRIPALLSTGTMELGIDVGAIDLVLQLNSPGSVSSGLQRVGRAGHLLHQRSKGRIMPLYREDLVECAVVARRMEEGTLEPTRTPQNALDVLAQHIVSAVALEPWTGEQLLELFHHSAPYANLGRKSLDAVLGLLAGRYPADIARGLAAKITWERTTDRVTSLPGAGLLAITAGGTIPDRGYYSLVLTDGTRLGELEEEFVYERQVGDIIAFGSASWRIQDIDRQKVVVNHAPGQPAIVPFWKGGHFGRDPDLSEAIGAFRRQLYERADDAGAAEAWLHEHYPVDPWAAQNLASYFADQRHRGHPLGTDLQVVVEYCQDDLGDHQLVIHSSFGGRLNTPWTMALRRQLRLRSGVDPQVMSDDDAILVRLPAGEEPPPLGLLGLVNANNLEDLVLEELSESAMYGALFRQNANRFLVLGTRGIKRRNPLWLQRLRAKDLQEATVEMPDFPVRLETFRQCLQDMMDLPRLAAVLERIAAGEIQVVTHMAQSPSPVASGVLNRFMAQYMYEYDEPRAERTLRQLQVDRSILDQMLGREDVARLLLPEAVGELQQRWQAQSENTRARTPDELLAVVLRLTLLAADELPSRCRGGSDAMVAQLVEDGRLVGFDLQAGDEVSTFVCVTEDLPLIIMALGPERCRTEADAAPGWQSGEGELTVERARQLLVLRVLDNLGPVTIPRLARRCGLPEDQLAVTLDQLVEADRVIRGPLLEGEQEPAFCTRTNLKQIRRRSLTRARQQVEPVDPPVLQQMVLEHQRLGKARLSTAAALPVVLEQLTARAMPALILERDVLPSRIEGYEPTWLDDLVSSGDWVWTGKGERRVVLLPRDALDLLVIGDAELEPGAEQLRKVLRYRGASFMGEICGASTLSTEEVQQRLWELVWAGLATNDRLESLRRGLVGSFKVPHLEPDLNPYTGRPSTFRRRRRRPAIPRRGGNAWSGRWSLLTSPEERATVHDAIWLLVSRYGLVARELVGLEDHVTWSELYPVLCQLELCGDLLRGVFVRGLSSAQFAPVETVDRLRALRRARSEPVLLNACDPALVAPALGLPVPNGATLVRRPSTYVVLQDGSLVLLLDALGKRLQLDPETSSAQLRQRLPLLLELLDRGHKAVRVEQVNGQPAAESPLRGPLEEQGFLVEGEALEKRRFHS